MGAFVTRPFTPTDAEDAAAWAYEPPYERYNSDAANPALFLTLDDAGYGYHAIVDADDNDALIGFCCFGAEAPVAGQTEEPSTLDVGFGVRPDRVGQRLGTSMFPAVLEFAARRFAARRLRAAVGTFNERSTRLCQSAGFVIVRQFAGPDDQAFQELVRESA